MKKGEIIYAKTHAEFLNKTFNTNYKSYMRCIYNFNRNLDVWMIELSHQKSAYGFYNYLKDESTLIERCDKLRDLCDQHREYMQKNKFSKNNRAIFAIYNKGSINRKYKFIGIFTPYDESMTENVWKKIGDEL